MTDYRNRIYQDYTNLTQDVCSSFDESDLISTGKAYNTFLRGWLSRDKKAAILDVGCGSGRLLSFLKEKGFENLQGVDISSQQVTLARKVLRNIVNEDAISFLKKRKKSYNLIVGLDIVEHFRKDEVLHFLEACFNALQPGGRLVLQTPNAESPWGLMYRYGDLTHELAFTPNSLKQLLTLCGFSEISAREAGPVAHGIVSLIRYLIWKAIRSGLIVWNLAETGSKKSGIYTRVFLISGIRSNECVE